MSDTSHLVSLMNRLSNEKYRLSKVTSNEEKELRTVWVNQIQKEIDSEFKFLGIDNSPINPEISDDDLLNDLFN